MVLAVKQFTAVDDAGNVLPGATITVRQETGGAPLAPIYADRDGITPLTNPFIADAAGFARFYAAGGAYRIDITLGGLTTSWRYVAIGTMAEVDFDSLPDIAVVQTLEAGYALLFETVTAAPPSAGALRFNNADLSLATEAYVSGVNVAAASIKARLLELYSAARTVKDVIIITDRATGAQASFRVDGASDAGAYVTLAIGAHAGATSFPASRVSLQTDRAGADGIAGTTAADIVDRIAAQPSLDLMGDDLALLLVGTRGSIATYVGPDGLLKTAAANVPRVTYDPVSRAVRGFLCEKNTTNLLERSEEIDNAYWTKQQATVSANAAVAPDGATTADTLTEDSSNNVHAFVRSPSFTSGTRYCTSVFAKAAGRSELLIILGSAAFGANVTARFNLTTITATLTTPGTNSACGIENYGNGWFRCWISSQATATASASVAFYLHNGSSSTYAGDGSSGIHFWGAQLEVDLTAPSSYVKTVSGTASRSSDAFVLGLNSDWFNASEGVWMIDVTCLAALTNGTSGLVMFDDGTSSHRSVIREGTVIAGADYFVSSGSVVVDTGSFAFGAGERARFAAAYKVNDFAFTKNAAAVLTDTSGPVPVGPTRCLPSTGGAHIVHRMMYWPQRLSNANLQTLTV